MNDDGLDCFSLDNLEQLQGRYEARNDRAGVDRVRAAIDRKGAVQTAELYRSGKLFAHETPRDSTGRVMTFYTGDPMAWMHHFMGQGARGRLDSKLLDEARSGKLHTVRTRPGEHVQIVRR